MEINGIKIEPQSGEAGVNKIGFSITSINESIDKELVFDGVCGDKTAPLHVIHEGLRQPFGFSNGGVFRVKDGGRFGVLKVGGVEPDEPTIETYTRLTYLETTGEQYINLGYVVKDTDVITIKYSVTEGESGRMYGCEDASGNSIYWSLSGGRGYARFGNAKSTIITDGVCSNFSTLCKESVSINTWQATMPYVAMPNTPLCLFAFYGTNMIASRFSTVQCSEFSISDSGGSVKMLLLPHRRNSDGKVGMLDIVSNDFYVNEGIGADFIGGNAINLASGYELIESVTFNADKLYDLGVVSDEDSIDIMFQRTSASASEYLYGLTNSGNTASCTAYMASNGAWRYGSQLVRPNTANTNVHRAFMTNGSFTFDGEQTPFTEVSFKTFDSVVLGGYRDSNGNISPTYYGLVNFIRLNNGKRLEWLPTRRLSDGEEGFWDCVTNSFVHKNN